MGDSVRDPSTFRSYVTKRRAFLSTRFGTAAVLPRQYGARAGSWVQTGTSTIGSPAIVCQCAPRPIPLALTETVSRSRTVGITYP